MKISRRKLIGSATVGAALPIAGCADQENTAKTDDPDTLGEIAPENTREEFDLSRHPGPLEAEPISAEPAEFLPPKDAFGVQWRSRDIQEPIAVHPDSEDYVLQKARNVLYNPLSQEGIDQEVEVIDSVQNARSEFRNWGPSSAVYRENYQGPPVEAAAELTIGEEGVAYRIADVPGYPRISFRVGNVIVVAIFGTDDGYPDLSAPLEYAKMVEDRFAGS